MKITDLRALSLSRRHEPERVWASATFRVPKADASVVVIDTDEGVRGLGEASAYGTPPRIAERVAALRADLVGRDPLEVDLPAQTAANRADAIPLAGVDCALWDLRGRILGRRVCDLLAVGADVPDRVRLYASAGVSYDWDERPEQVVDEAAQLADEGYTAFKMRLGTHWAWSGVTVARFLDLARRVDAAVGSRMDLMLDGNGRLTESEALAIGRALDEMDWFWYEEPIPGDQLDGYARLSQALELPVTGGESLWTWAQLEPPVTAGAYEIVQVDAGVCGLTECRRVEQAAWLRGVPHCPHNWHNGLLTLAHAHLVAAAPSGPAVRGARDRRLRATGRAPTGSWHGLLELNMVQGPLQWGLLAEPPAIEEGHLVLPDGPGLGVALAEDVETQFPYIEGPWGERQTR